MSKAVSYTHLDVYKRQLIEWGWVKAVGYKGEIFELTGTGYSKADWLKNNMAIDTSKEPLDELKEFED